MVKRTGGQQISRARSPIGSDGGDPVFMERLPWERVSPFASAEGLQWILCRRSEIFSLSLTLSLFHSRRILYTGTFVWLADWGFSMDIFHLALSRAVGRMVWWVGIWVGGLVGEVIVWWPFGGVKEINGNSFIILRIKRSLIHSLLCRIHGLHGCFWFIILAMPDAFFGFVYSKNYL